MSEATADSAGAPGEATGAVPQGAADSTPTPVANGQEQGDQKRINGLMSLAQKRTAERDEALAEIESLREMLAQSSVAPEEERQPTQRELMYPEQYAFDDATEQGDPLEQPEPLVVVMGVNPMRPDHAARPVTVPAMSNPSAAFLENQSEIASLRKQVNSLGLGWARSNGFVDSD